LSSCPREEFSRVLESAIVAVDEQIDETAHVDDALLRVRRYRHRGQFDRVAFVFATVGPRSAEGSANQTRGESGGSGRCCVSQASRPWPAMSLSFTNAKHWSLPCVHA